MATTERIAETRKKLQLLKKELGRTKHTAGWTTAKV